MAVGSRRGVLPGVIVSVLLVTVAGACGKTSEDGPAMTAGASPQAGSGAVASSGASATGGADGGRAGTGGNLGAAGEPVAEAGRGGAGAGILAALDTTDAMLDGASGLELLTLGLQIGYARGFAMCTCLPAQPLPEDALQGCVEEESTYGWVYQQKGREQCLLDKARSIPGFDERLRCRTRRLRADGKVYAACADGTDTRSMPVSPECAENSAADILLTGSECNRAFLCADGARFDTGQCDRKRDCPDGADERGCRNVICGDELLEYLDACDPEKCGVFDPPLCELGNLRLFCGDGQEVSAGALCDGNADCATGRDEQYCY